MLTTAVAFTSISFPAAAAPADAQAMAKAAVSEAGAREINLNKDWKFNLGDMTGAEQASYDDSQWRRISFPHHFSIIQEFSNSYRGGVRFSARRYRMVSQNSSISEKALRDCRE